VAGEAWAKGWRGGAESKKDMDKQKIEEWERKWRATQPAWTQRNARPPDPKVLQLHEGLRKAESSMLIQAPTEKIGLAQFLYTRGVPGVVTALYSCGVGPETARHVVIYCEKEVGRHQEVRREDARRTLDYRWLTNTNTGARKLSRWLIQSGRLP
jgi:hypothetical protein